MIEKSKEKERSDKMETYTIDIDLLPDEGKEELLSYYNKLLKKYKITKNESISGLENFYDKIKIDTRKWKFNREELHER